MTGGSHIRMAVLLALFGWALAQTSWAREAEQRDATAAYLSRDFASLLMPKTPFLGYIGSDYRRLRIHFETVIRDKSNSALYHVTGTSRVGSNVCDFQGEIRVKRITKLLDMHFGVDDEYKDKGIQAEGVLAAEYGLRETPSQPHAGVFKGKASLSWYVDRKGTLKYDRIEDYSDGYRNNQYEGTWTPYGDGAGPKKANWGEFRIPDSGELDRGAGEFGPDPKFPGWKDHKPGD